MPSTSPVSLADLVLVLLADAIEKFLGRFRAFTAHDPSSSTMAGSAAGESHASSEQPEVTLIALARILDVYLTWGLLTPIELRRLVRNSVIKRQ